MIQSLDRGLTLLKLVGERPLSVTEAAEQLGVDLSTASRLLATLRAHDLVARDDETHRFVLGPDVLRLSASYTGRLDWLKAARPLMRGVRDCSQETVSVTMFDGRRVIYVDCLDGTQRLRTIFQLGEVAHWHAGAAGKCVLAFISAAERDAVLASIELERYTDNTICEREALSGELARIRRRGFATGKAEIDPAVFGIAVPLLGRDGRVLGSLGVTAPVSRMDTRNQEIVRNALQRAREAFCGGVLVPTSEAAAGER